MIKSWYIKPIHNIAMDQDFVSLVILTLYFVVDDYYTQLSNTKSIITQTIQEGGSSVGNVEFHPIRFAIDNATGIVRYLVLRGVTTINDLLPEDWGNLSGSHLQNITPRIQGAFNAAQKIMEDPVIRKELGNIIATTFETISSIMNQPATKQAIDNVLQTTSKNVEKIAHTIARTGTSAAINAVDTAAGMVPFAGSVLNVAQIIGTMANGATSIAESIITPATQAAASSTAIAKKAITDTVQEQQRISSALDRVKNKTAQILTTPSDTASLATTRTALTSPFKRKSQTVSPTTTTVSPATTRTAFTSPFKRKSQTVSPATAQLGGRRKSKAKNYKKKRSAYKTLRRIKSRLGKYMRQTYKHR